MNNNYELLNQIKVFMLDMDGTIYLGDEILPGSKSFLDQLKKLQKKYVFLTNNSAKSTSAYVNKLAKMGIQATEAEILTSGDVTAYYLNEQKPGAKLYVLGTSDLKNTLARAGFEVIEDSSITPDYVVLGFDTDITYKRIWDACNYLWKGVKFIATHPDLNCPLPRGQKMPDTGAMIALFEAATGVKPTIIGKPSKWGAELVGEKLGVKPNEICMVGDRLYTDIMMGQTININTALVYSGETKESYYKNQNEIKATFCFQDLGEIVKHLK